jgi:hypothetical protein
MTRLCPTARWRANLESVPLDRATIRCQDVVVALVPQIDVDWRLVAEAAPVVLDCCNALNTKSEMIRRL